MGKIENYNEVFIKKLLYTIKDTAFMLSLHPQTVYEYVRQGKIQPVNRIGKDIRIPISTIEKIIEEGGIK